MKRKPAPQGISNIIAIHGAPRSGTSWVGQLFNSNEHVAYRYQPLFSYAFKNTVNRDSDAAEWRSFFDRLLVTQDDFVLQRGAAALAGYELEFPKLEITHLAYKEVRYHEVLQNLLSRLPTVRGIGIIRNPCAVIHSWLHAPREFRQEWDILSEWKYAPEKNRNKPENWYGFEKWKELAYLFSTLAERFPGRFRIVRYEELLASTETVLADMFGFCGLQLTPQVVEFIQTSRRQDDGQSYGVYRRHSSEMSPWKKNLDSRIADAIKREIADTKLEQYLTEI